MSRFCSAAGSHADIGYPIGRHNPLGVAVFDNAVLSPGWRTGLPRYLPLRLALECETVASLIAESDAGRMLVCFGNPCALEYESFAFDGVAAGARPAVVRAEGYVR